jgi:hypothetical protein
MDNGFSMKEVVLEIRETVRELNSKVSGIPQITRDVEQLAGESNKLHDALFAPKTGLVVRVEKLENWAEAQRKVLWEIAKPGLGMVGIILIVGVGILATLLYGLQVLLQAVTP